MKRGAMPPRIRDSSKSIAALAKRLHHFTPRQFPHMTQSSRASQVECGGQLVDAVEVPLQKIQFVVFAPRRGPSPLNGSPPRPALDGSDISETPRDRRGRGSFRAAPSDRRQFPRANRLTSHANRPPEGTQIVIRAGSSRTRRHRTTRSTRTRPLWTLPQLTAMSQVS